MGAFRALMPFDEATHGPWCNTRVWPTNCPGCGHSVFFFSCNHGSKVFFDALGRPWPVHDCDTSWTRGLKRTTDSTGRITVHLSAGVSVSRPPDTFNIAPEIVERAKQSPIKEAQAPIVCINPEPTRPQAVIGVLREIRQHANPYRYHNIPDTTFGSAALGPIGQQSVGRITVHTPLNSESSQLASYTMWIPAALISNRRIKTGITVHIGLQVISLLGGERVWFCDEFEVIG